MLRDSIHRMTNINLDEIIKKIMRYFHKINRPTFLGHVAVEIGHSIEQTELFFDTCVDRGYIRKATIQELAQVGGNSHSIVYVLVGRDCPRYSHIP